MPLTPRPPAQAASSRASVARIARCDTERGIHVGPLHGFELPPHLLAALDTVMEGEPSSEVLRAGQTALVVSASPSATMLTTRLDTAVLDRFGVLWTTYLTLGGDGTGLRSEPE